MKMPKTDKATAIIKLLKQGYSASQIRDRIGVSYNYAWKLEKAFRAKAEVEVEVEPQPQPGEYVVVEGAKSVQEIDAILNERGSRYGNFLDHARVTYKLKEVARSFAEEKGKTFAVDQCEAMDMIFHKLGRILNGDPNYADSWVDIAGYAQLVADRLQGHVR